MMEENHAQPPPQPPAQPDQPPEDDECVVQPAVVVVQPGDRGDRGQANLDGLVHMRGVLRTNITGQVRYIDQLLNNDVLLPNEMLDLETIRDTLPVKLNRLANFNDMIHAELPRERLLEDFDACVDHDHLARRAINSINNYLRDHAPVPVIPVSALPKIELQPFDGTVENFRGFWDIFESQVHLNPALTNIQRFAYLKPLLIGQAATAVAGWTNSATDYEQLVGQLGHRFDRVQIAQDSYMHRLLNLKPLPSDYTTESLRLHHDQIVQLVAGLDTKNVDITSYQTIGVPLIIKSLPPDLQFKFTKIMDQPGHNGDLRLLLTEFLRYIAEFLRYIEIREWCNSLVDINGSSSRGVDPNLSRSNYHSERGRGGGNSNRNFNPRQIRGQPRGIYTAASNFDSTYDSVTSTHNTQTQHVTPRNTQSTQPANTRFTESAQKCHYCNGNHFADKCTTYPTFQQRMEVLRKVKACFNCLSINKPVHSAQNCPSCGRCRHCKQKHHTSIHRHGNESNNNNNTRVNRGPHVTISDVLAASGHQQNPPVTQNTGATNTNVSVANLSTDVFLQTALVDITNPLNGRSCRARALLDGASQMSHVYEKVAQALDLPVLGSEHILAHLIP